MDTKSLYVSLDVILAALALVLGWTTVSAQRVVGSAFGMGGSRHGVPLLNLAELLWMLGLMLAFYWFGMYLGLLLLGAR